MMDGKDYCAMEMGFSFVNAFIDRTTGYNAGLRLKEVHTRYSKIVNLLLFRGDGVGFSEIEITEVAGTMAELAQSAM